jgi:cytochrome d ubiquinol oxidase subunit I
VACHYLRHERFVPEARVMVSGTMWLLLLLVPCQILLGDASGLITEHYQPAKLAAIEARWDTASRVPLTLFAIPDQQAATNHHALEIPDLGSLILTHDPNGTVRGLKDFPRQDWPPVAVPFFAFRIMVGLGLLMLAVVIVGNVLRRGGRLFTNRAFLLVCEICAPIGFLAVLAGWTTTEVGRQPWRVFGLLRTADSVSPSLTGWNVVVSLAGYVLAYAIIFPSGWLVASRIVRRGIGPVSMEDGPVGSGRPRSPVRPVALEATYPEEGTLP